MLRYVGASSIQSNGLDASHYPSEMPMMLLYIRRSRKGHGPDLHLLLATPSRPAPFRPPVSLRSCRACHTHSTSVYLPDSRAPFRRCPSDSKLVPNRAHEKFIVPRLIRLRHCDHNRQTCYFAPESKPGSSAATEASHTSKRRPLLTSLALRLDPLV